jgi:hypothetical protein
VIRVFVEQSVITEKFEWRIADDTGEWRPYLRANGRDVDKDSAIDELLSEIVLKEMNAGSYSTTRST